MTTCTICGDALAGAPDDDRCCLDCDAANFPPPADLPLPWWQAARVTLAPCRDGRRALPRREETRDGPTPT